MLAQSPMGLPPCGTDAASEALLTSSPFYAARLAEFEEAWEQTTSAESPSMASMPLTDSMEVLEIPVVVHVIHRGSEVGQEENISDEQVLSAVTALNNDFRKVPGSNGDGNGVDVFIQFVLAKRTPDGGPTTGIVRVDGSSVPSFAEHGVSSLTGLPGADEEELKSITTWYGQDYLNVFVVPEINGNDGGPGVQGFSYTGPTGDARDGVTLLYNVIGTVGTLKPGRTLNRTLTHEVGHHLSLLHTFHQTFNCNVESNCTLAGDRVCDTPPTVENTLCSTGNCPDALLDNYLDYTPTTCRNAFTAGQRERMRTCLETVRSSLLESLGALPIVAVDLVPVGLDAANVCSPTWSPVLSVQNQGVSTAPGVAVNWSVNGVALATAHFEQDVPSGATVHLALPEVLLPGATSTWNFSVSISEEGAASLPDDYPINNDLAHVLNYQGDDRWSLFVNTDFFANEVAWEVRDSLGFVVWSGGDYPFGTNNYLHEACMAPGCYTLEMMDSGDDGLALGGSVVLCNAIGDTLVHIPAGTNYGASVSFAVCAETPPTYNPGNSSDDSTCHDFNLNGLCDETEVPGCTYPGAPNFNPQATMDDGSCQASCPGDLNGDGAVQLSDLLSFLVAFGSGCL